MPTQTFGSNSTNTYIGSEDNQIKSNNADANYGGRTTIEATKWADGNHTHILLGFSSLSNLPANITVSSATIYLCHYAWSEGTRTFTARRLLRSWVEGSEDGNAQSGSSSWNSYGSGSWTSGGALSDGNDRASVVSGTGSIEGPGWLQITGSQLCTDVQNGYTSWHIERTDGTNDSTYDGFYSSEADDTYRPYISVTYEVNSSTPSGLILVGKTIHSIVLGRIIQ